MRTSRLAGLCVATLLLSPAVAAAEDAYIVEMKGYVLRTSPKGSSEAVGRVTVGDKVLVMERTAGWVRVETADQKGWLPESTVGSQPPASVRLGPVQERVAGLEAAVQGLETEKQGLQEENALLSSRVSELEQSYERAKKEVAEVRSSGHFREIALGGGLVIIGWLAGFALRRRGGSSRYRIE